METINLSTIIGFSDKNTEQINYFDKVDAMCEPTVLQAQGTFNQDIYKKVVRIKNTISIKQENSNDISIYSNKFSKKIEIIDSISGNKVYVDYSCLKSFLDAFKTIL